MNPKRVQAIVLKEVRDTLRDRRALFVMMILPLLLYPVLIVAFLHMSAIMKKKLEDKRFKVAAVHFEDWPEGLKQAFKDHEKLDVQALNEAVADPGQALKDRDFALLLKPPKELKAILERGEQARVLVQYDKGVDGSRLAQREVLKLLYEYATEVRAKRLESRRIARSFFEPIDIETENLGRESIELVRALSMMLIILGLTGAFYPALDLGAGEKERGTLETLLLTPTQRTDIALGKYLAIMLVALSSGALNVGSMALTFANLGAVVPAGMAEKSDLSVSWSTFVAMLLALVPLIALFSALALALSTRAASYKEGQNYLSPLMMAVIFPAMASALPGLQLTAAYCLVPVMGTSLLFRDLLSGAADSYQVVFVTAANLFYAWLSIRWVASLYDQEDVLMRPAALSGAALFPALQAYSKENKEAWASIPEAMRRRPGLPSSGQALLMFAVALVLVNGINIRLGVDRFVASKVLVAVSLLLGLGVGGTIMLGIDGRRSFALTKPRPKILGSALLLGAAAFALLLYIKRWQTAWIGDWTPKNPSPEEISAAMKLVSTLQGLGPFKAILLLALLPALSSEVLLRGPIREGLKADFGRASAVMAAAVLGALLSFSVPEFLPTVLLGVVAACLVELGGSIAAAVVFQFSAQALFVYYTLHPKVLFESSLISVKVQGMQSELSLTGTGLAVFATALLAGLALLVWDARTQAQAKSTQSAA